MRSMLSVAAATSLLICQAPAYAEDEKAALEVMSINLQDVVRPDFGFQGETQGDGRMGV